MSDPMKDAQKTIDEIHAELCEKISSSTILQSLLYDLDLLPEQLKDDDVKRWIYIETIVGHVDKLERELAAEKEARVKEEKIIDNLCGQMRRDEEKLRPLIEKAGCDPEHHGADIAIKELLQRAEALQAKIEQLMLEYCPEEMTTEQIVEFERHQHVATSEESAVIDAARKGDSND